MSKIKTLITNILNLILSYIPTRLPTGVTAYEAWLNNIVSLIDFQVDEQSLKWVISQEIMRLPPTGDCKSKRYFVKVLRKYAANQIAANKVMEIKQAQEERVKAAQQQAGDTAKDQACPPATTTKS